jgi:starch synthase
MFLMPSRFEPCGLGQIISLRYGTIPVVRATGGLAETVTDIDSDAAAGNGFSFSEFTPEALISTLERALKYYNGDAELWRKLVKKAMSTDFSWTRSAQKYVSVYNRAVSKQH